MLKRGLLFLLVFIIFLENSFAQENTCIIASSDSVAPVAQRILDIYSGIYDNEEEAVEAAIDSVNRWDPPKNIDQNWINYKEKVISVISGKEVESFSDIKARAKRELRCNGITREQREAYIPGVSDFIYQTIDPDHTAEYFPSRYQFFFDRTKKVFFNIVRERNKGDYASEDAWRLYLGLPQEYNTFRISDYKPSKGGDDKYYYRLERVYEKVDRFLSFNLIIRGGFDIHHYLRRINESGDDFIIEENGPQVLENFKISKGQDEKGSYLSYYDIWDLNVPIEGDEGFFGKPFEIYDRIYYDPKTFEILPDKPEEEISC